jgi:membrane-associated protein
VVGVWSRRSLSGRWRPGARRRLRGGGAVGPADAVILVGIGLRALYGFAMLLVIPLMLAPHPLLLELISGSTVAEVVVGARVRLGEISWPVAISAGVPLWLAFDWLYWWAGRRWGDRTLTLLLSRRGRPGAAKRAAHLERVARRFGPSGVVLAWFLPVPSLLIYATAGLTGMHLVTFLLLDLVGTTLAVAVVVGLGYALGQRAVDLVGRFDHYALLTSLVLLGLVVVVHLVRRRRGGRPGA